jgi:uncharacterized protein YciI
MAADDVLHLLLYEYVPDMAQRREPYRGAHRDRITAEREAGVIVTAGAFDPPTGGALVFKGVDPEYVEAFVTADPYMQGGLITSYSVRRWTTLW